MKVTKESKAYDAIANNPPPKFVKEAEKTGVNLSSILRKANLEGKDSKVAL